MPLPIWTAGRRIRASELTAVNTQVTADGVAIDALGEMTAPVNGGTSAPFTTTEIAVNTLTATFTAGRKGYVMATFTYGSTIAGDVAIFRIRYRAGASIGVVNTATLAQTRTVKAVAAATGYPFVMICPLPSLSGQYTVALTAIRSSGTGTMQVDGTVDGNDRTVTLLDMGT